MRGLPRADGRAALRRCQGGQLAQQAGNRAAQIDVGESSKAVK